jgi:metal-responsive CopG/Arc/MetJ family transcriptional regulator
VVYVERTQIYLSAEDVAALDQHRSASGATRSELIRRAIREVYGGTDAEARRQTLAATAGAWAPSEEDGEQYVESLRADLHERLQRVFDR